MKKLLQIVLVFCVAVQASAGSPIPPEIQGVWATENSELRGDTLVKGSVIYLNGDGVGAAMSGDGNVVRGMRVTIRSYDAGTGLISINILGNNAVIGTGELVYDASKLALVSARDHLSYSRRFETISPVIRKAIGLQSPPEQSQASGKARGP